MATITKNGTFKAFRLQRYEGWNSWSTSSPTGAKSVVDAIAYRVDAPESYPITAAALNISIKELFDITSYTFTAGIYDTDPTVGGTPLKTQTFTSGGDQTHTFEFNSLSIAEAIPYQTLYFLLTFTFSTTEEPLVNDPVFRIQANYAEFSLTVPALSVGVTPSALYAGNRITADFTNRIGETLTVRVFYNTTMLYETTAASDSLVINCPESWFNVAGVTGNSMGLKLRASDGNGRTSNDAGFTLNRATGGTISPIAPRSTTVNGNEAISFSWSYSGDGTLTKTELQWSTDNATWSDLATISGSGTTWTAAAYKFSKGTIYWRARATNSFGLVGNWSSSVSFTVSFPTLSVGVTPSSLYAGSQITASFTNRLSRTLTVQFFYNSTLLYTTMAASDSASILCEEAWFTTAGVSGNSMSVKIRASDDMGRVSSDVSFTVLRPVGGTISPIAPRSTTLDGTASINFAWVYSGDGTLTKTELQWSRDNAAWTDLATVSGNGTSWTAPAISFPAGTIYWRARATNSFGLVGAWSSGVSFTVKYAAQSQAVPVNSPTGGIISAAQAQTFQVALEASAQVYEPFTISSATFYWRAGESGDYNAVTMTPNGNSASVTIPAGTFPSGGIQWYAEATDNTGRTTQTSVFSLSTLNAAVEAVPIAPNNTVESSDAVILFRWRYASLDGSASAGAELQKSADGIDWSNLVSVPAGLESVPVSGAGFAAGKVFWRVRAQNAAGDWSDWSTALSFQVFGAPVISSVSGDGKPFLTVNWQVEGQLAYKIEVDGKTYGPYRGESTRSFTLPEPLPDGLHVVKVAAQNRYALWSAWAEASVSVTNVPGPQITIDAEWQQSENIRIVYTDAIIAPEIIKTLPETVRIDMGRWTLSAVEYYSAANVFQWYFRANESQAWTAIDGATGRNYTIEGATRNNGQYRVKVSNPVGEVYSNISNFTYDAFSTSYVSDIFNTNLYAETGHFLIYRDGALIGTTRRNYFYDRTALGSHEYYVLQVLPGGYYTKSNVVTLTGFVDCPAIALLSGGEFLMLELSENANRTQTITKTGEVAYIQYSGAKYQEAEIGEAESLTATGDVSFTAAQEADARSFESMLKKAVIYKTPGGEVVVGILQGFTRRDPRFFKSYSFQVTQMERRDFVNA